MIPVNDRAISEGLGDYAEILAIRAHRRANPISPALAAKRWARAKALRLGLAYWPALAYGPRIDPSAYVAAEQVLSARHGTWNPAAGCHGGWDAQGHHGLSAERVSEMWFAAGCADTPKFRAQVRSGILARKGDSLPWFLAYARGSSWCTAHACHIDALGALSRKAVAALGRLSPELRHAAMSGVQLPDYVAGRYVALRIRDLNWLSVSQLQAKLATASADGALRIRAALAGPRRAAQLLGQHATSALLSPAYPDVPLSLAGRLALGETPVQLAAGALTRAEAHAWLKDGAPELSPWILRRSGIDLRTRSVRIAQWLVAVHLRQQSAALYTERTTQIPGGGLRNWRAVDVLDELQDADIIAMSDGVGRVLERSAQRLGAAWLTDAMSDHRQLADRPCWAGRLPKCAVLLLTPAQLADEGEALNHCVGGYAESVRRGQCHIVSIRGKKSRSTVELSSDGRQVRQHHAARNGSAPRRHWQMVDAFIQRIAR